MTRRESLLALAVAFTLVIAGLVWLIGPWGLIVGGLGLASATLFGFERVREGEGRRGEDLADAVPQRSF